MLLVAAAGVALVLGLRPAPPKPPPEIRNLDTLVRAYLEANGGLEKIESVVSMRTSGWIHYPGDRESTQFTIIKRRPDRFWSTFRLGDRSIVEAHDGEETWRMVAEHETNRRELQVLSGAEREQVLRHSVFDSLLVREFENYERLRFTGKREFRDRSYYEVRVETGDLNRERFILIEPDTFTDAYHLEHLVREGQTHVVHHDRFRKVQDLNLPFLVTRETDAGMQWQMEIEKVELNPGVTTAFFRRPSDL